MTKLQQFLSLLGAALGALAWAFSRGRRSARIEQQDEAVKQAQNAKEVRDDIQSKSTGAVRAELDDKWVRRPPGK